MAKQWIYLYENVLQQPMLFNNRNKQKARKHDLIMPTKIGTYMLLNHRIAILTSTNSLPVNSPFGWWRNSGEQDWCSEGSIDGGWDTVQSIVDHGKRYALLIALLQNSFSCVKYSAAIFAILCRSSTWNLKENSTSIGNKNGSVTKIWVLQRFEFFVNLRPIPQDCFEDNVSEVNDVRSKFSVFRYPVCSMGRDQISLPRV